MIYFFIIISVDFSSRDVNLKILIYFILKYDVVADDPTTITCTYIRVYRMKKKREGEK